PERHRAPLPARAPRRGDHRAGPVRRAAADLGPGREPPPRPEGSARAADRRLIRERLGTLRASFQGRRDADMPSSKSPSGGSRAGSRARSSTRSSSKSGAAPRSSTRRADTNAGGDGLSGLTEQLVNRIIKPLGLVVLSRERIQEVLDDAAARGRVTRSDANDLVAELVNRGRQQTEQLLSDAERLVGRGRQQLGAATSRARRSESLDLLLRSADRARRTVGTGQ